MLRQYILLLMCSATLFGQKYTGPQPEKADLVYLVHADSLVPTETGDAKEENRKDDVVAVVAGATSSAATPLASPIFLIRADKINADALEIYKLEVKNGRREVVLTHKKKPVRETDRLLGHEGR